MATGSPTPWSKQRSFLVLAVIIAVAATLRFGFAANKSLVLDEFHSYFHASRSSVDSFFQTLRLDNHPPLSFAMISASRSIFGESELALRLPAILFGLTELLLVARIAKLLGLNRGRLLAVALLAASSLHLDFSTQVRMYALHALAVTGLVEAILSTLSIQPNESTAMPRTRIALWLTVGMLNHYFFVQYAFWIAVAGLIATRLDWKRLRVFVFPTVCAAVLCLPWYATGFREQLGHELPPGGDNIGVKALGEAFVHMFFLNVRLGGETLRQVFICSGILTFLSAVIGCLMFFARSNTGRDRAGPIFVATIAFWVPVATTVTAALFARAGFTWHYVLPSAAALAIFAAHFADQSRLGRAVVSFAIASAFALSILNAMSPGTENFRGAVKLVLDQLQPGDAVVSVEWQPPLFPQGQPYNYYSTRVGLMNNAPQLLPMNGGFSVAWPEDLLRHQRVWVLSSRLPNQALLLRTLRENFEQVSSERFGFQPTVLLFALR